MITVGVVLADVAVAFHATEEMELFDASNIDLEQPRWIAKAITKFACRRTQLTEDLFTTKLVKLEDTKRLTAQFGLAILVSEGVLSESEISDLKKDVAVYAPRIAGVNESQPQLDFNRPERQTDFYEKLESAIAETSKDIRRELGGKKITMPIQVRTDEKVVAHIEGSLIRKLDTPPEPFDNELIGTAKNLQFLPRWECKLIERKNCEAGGAAGRTITAIIGKAEVFDAVVALGRTPRAAKFKLTSYSMPGRSNVVELLDVQPLDADLGPLEAAAGSTGPTVQQ